ncbi:FeoC-like transcriptional regulator [Streptomyces venezuelae]|uniref:FeoC-like transcriptional regulator n=1 Tax=Streptomyces venezuelae TaxID=54571 RepID=UPI003646D8E9
MSGKLREFLREFEAAAPGVGLGALARRLGVSTAEASAMAQYWVRKGRIHQELVGAPDCSGCFFASRGCTDCPPTAAGAPLVRLTPGRDS